MGLEETVNERVSFLKEQINPNNRPIVNDTFQLQIDVLTTAKQEHIANLIRRKQLQLENCNTIYESDMLFTELEALEWLQRQANRDS
jgi:hypothetical protein